MGRRLFGTDGVRGVAGIEITGQLALALGRAVVNHSGLDAPRALVIRDTRESGEMLEAALAAGIASAGGEVALGGVLPTPAAPLLIARHRFDLAVVISASHNPYTDNGIKFFGSDGFKLSDDTEREIELHIDEDVGGGGARIGRIRRLDGSTEDYIGELERRFAGLSLDGLDVVLDCANGATFEVAPEIFAPPRRPRDGALRHTGRAQHQRGLRLDAPGRAGGGGARRRPRPRLRLRRRRRPHARRRPPRERSSTATSCWRWPRSTCATAADSPAAAWPSR